LEINNNNNLNSNNKLNSKNKSKDIQKGNLPDVENNQTEERQDFDQKLIAQLNKFIQEDNSFFIEQGRKINESANNINDEIKEDKIEEKFDNKFDGVLVKRPPKGFVWGMGNQTNKKKCKKILYYIY